MNTRTRNALFGGALLLGGAFYAFYLYRKNQAREAFEKEFKPVSKKLIIQILKEEKRELFPLIRCVAQTSKQNVEQSDGKLTYDVVQKFLLTNNTLIIDKVREISRILYEKHGIEEKDMLYACQITHGQDLEIQALLRRSKTSFDNAFQGVLPDPNTEIPSFLTPERLLEVLAKLKKDTLYKAQNLVKILTNQGITLAPNRQRYLYGFALYEMKLNNTERKILVEEGLNEFADAPEKIIDFALAKYEKENDEFRHKLQDLELQNADASEAVMKSDPNATHLIEAIGSQPVLNPAVMGTREANEEEEEVKKEEAPEENNEEVLENVEKEEIVRIEGEAAE